MKKILSFFAAMLLCAFTANAKTIEIDPGANTLLTAIDNAADDDVIVLNDNENGDPYTIDNYIVLGKSIELKAADGAKPVVDLYTYIKVQDNASVKISGIKFDAANQGSYSYFIRIYDVNTLELEGCEFLNAGNNVVIKVESDKHINTLKINNCIFNGGHNSVINVPSRSSMHACDKVQITNSTIANFTGFGDALLRINSKGGDFASDAKDDQVIEVDHCTFYNFIKNADNTYGFIDSRKSTLVTVSNCIFMNPEIPEGSKNALSTQTYGGTVTNCLDYGTKGHRLTCTNRINQDPKFKNASGSDFTLDPESPAIDQGTDGKTLGDPRWWPAVVHPETDFAEPYICTPANAKLAGKVSLTDNNLKWGNNEDETQDGVASWKINVTKACFVSATVTEESGSGHCYLVEILDAEGEAYADPVAEAADTWKSGDLALPGTLFIPEAGEYTIKLTNSTDWSGGTVSALTIAFAADAPTAAAKGAWDDWADELPFVVAKDGKTASAKMNLNKGDEFTFKLIINGEWRANGWWYKRDVTGAENITDNGDDMKIIADRTGEYVFTWTFATNAIAITFPALPKFYITGNAALVGEELNWNPAAIESMEDSHTLSLKADVDYMLKLTLNGTWEGDNNVKGFDALTVVADGLTRGEDENNDNICFKLAEDGDVTVTYKVVEDVVTFKLEGNFYVAPVAKFYIAGSMTEWDANMIPVYEDSYVLELEAGDHKLKVIDGEDWIGFDALTETDEGLSKDGDGNICFTLAEAGDVTVTYTGEVFTVEGDFYVEPEVIPYMAIIGDMNNWQGDELVLAQDELTASATIHLDMNDNAGYGFKVLIGDKAYCIEPDGEWYAFHRNWTSASGIDHVATDEEAFWLSIDMAGDYTFTWTLADKKLEITFPEKQVEPLEAPEAAPAAPEVSGDLVEAVYSPTYNADCNFGEWSSGTAYTQEDFGKKFVTNDNGYFGLEFSSMNCSKMEKLHLDVWIAEDASIRIVPIHGGTEVGVTKELEGQKWNSIDIALSEFEGVDDWSKVYQIKIDNAKNLTFWLNNVFFYATEAPAVDLADGYYLIGLHGWKVFYIDAADKFEAGETDGEFELVKDLKDGNAFKVVAVANNAITTWFPAEADNYVVDVTHAGEGKTIYFRPDYSGNDDWHAACIFVPENVGPYNPIVKTYFANPGWVVEEESSAVWDAENEKIIVNIATDKSQQWLAQVHVQTIIPEADKWYRVAVKLIANHDISGVTIKYSNNAPIFEENAVALTAETELEFVRVLPGKVGNGIIVYDFGFAKAGDVIEIYGLAVEEVDAPALNYYLVGSMNSWTVAAGDQYLFEANEQAEGEFLLATELAAGAEFKVVSVQGDQVIWYPAGDNYVVDEALAGAVTIYFRPDGQGGEDWHKGCIFVKKDKPTGIDNADATMKAQTMIENGQLIIIRNGIRYNAQGQMVR